MTLLFTGVNSNTWWLSCVAISKPKPARRRSSQATPENGRGQGPGEQALVYKPLPCSLFQGWALAAPYQVTPQCFICFCFVFLLIIGVFGPALDLAHRLGPFCHRSPYQGNKAQGNIASRIIRALNIPHHCKVAVQCHVLIKQTTLLPMVIITKLII